MSPHVAYFVELCDTWHLNRAGRSYALWGNFTKMIVGMQLPFLFFLVFTLLNNILILFNARLLLRDLLPRQQSVACLPYIFIKWK